MIDYTAQFPNIRQNNEMHQLYSFYLLNYIVFAKWIIKFRGYGF